MRGELGHAHAHRNVWFKLRQWFGATTLILL